MMFCPRVVGFCKKIYIFRIKNIENFKIIVYNIQVKICLKQEFCYPTRRDNI